MTQQYELERDLREAEAMGAGLARYVRGERLYGSVGGGFSFQGMPALTVGGLALRRRRLGLLAQGTGQRRRLAALEERCEEAREAWPRHYRDKMLREANSRLDTLRRYLQDEAGSSATAGRNWPPELLRRSIVEELRRALAREGVVDAALEAKTRLGDGLLMAIGDERCEFQWDAQLEAVYPEADYPWLYRRPRTGQ